MKRFRIPAVFVALLMAGCSAEREAALDLDPVPFAMKVPAAILPRLSTRPIEGPFAQDVQRAGALASTTVYYSPLEDGDKVIFMTAYWFPAEQFAVLQSPDQPPLFGAEVLRSNGNVLSVAGPLDAIFAPDTPDGQNLTELYGALYLPETYRAGKK